ncbi:hypothetical protein G9A89_002738 [Geosiphon pyriformis]|nr:hypothetical protein G9A89_002738 [Geosiphon pyriformis]
MAANDTSYNTLIIGWRLQGLHVLIIGGNQVAANRLEFANSSNPAKITVIYPRAKITSLVLIEHIDKGAISFINREFQIEDLDDNVKPKSNEGSHYGKVDLVLSATNNLSLSKEIAAAARKRRIPVNVAEIPELCDFLFMPTYRDKYLQFSVTTNNSSSPSGTGLVTRKIRDHLLNSLPKQNVILAAINNIGLLRDNLSVDSHTLATLSKITETMALDQLAGLSEEDIKILVAENSVSISNRSVDLDEVASSSSNDEKKSDDTVFDENTISNDNFSINSKFYENFLDWSSHGSHLIDGKTAVAYIAYALSSILFVYPGTTIEHVRQVAEQWASQNVPNIFEGNVVVQAMETRFGASTAILGVAEASRKISEIDLRSGHISTFATSQTIVNMIPNLYEISLQNIPMVVHVATQANDQELNNIVNYHDVLEARETGVSIINSYSVQEAHDIALIAYLCSALAKTPFLHIFDGVRTAHEFSNINTLSHIDILKLYREINSEETTSTNYDFNPHKVNYVGSSLSTISEFELVANKFGQKTGRHYKLFEYVGAHDSESILVVFGGETIQVRNAINKLGHYGGKVGAIVARVYRPWSEKHFLAAVPKTVKRIAILEQFADVTKTNVRHSSSLFYDVTASFQSDIWNGLPPILVDVKYPISQSINARIIKLLLHQLVTGTSINFNDELLSTIEISPSSHNLKQCIFWDSGLTTTSIATKHISKILTLDPQLNISCLSTHDAYNNGGVIKTHLQFGTDRISGVYEGEAGADFIAIHESNLISKYEILAAAKERTVVLLNTNWDVENLETKLPNDFRFEAAQRNIMLYLINAEKIVSEEGLNSEAVCLVLQIAFLRLYSNSKLDNSIQTAISDLYEGQNPIEIAKIIGKIIEKTENSLLRYEIPPTWLPLGKSDQALPCSIFNNSFGLNVDVPITKSKLNNWHKAAWNILFKEALNTDQKIRPDLPEKTFIVHVTENRRLTPLTYDRNLFHIEFAISDKDFTYDLGEALGVYGHNDPVEVHQFLEYYGLDPNDIISIPSKEGNHYETRTIFQLFSQILDIFGRPSKRFYESLAFYATDETEKNKLLWIASSEGSKEFKRRVDDTINYAELFYEFPSARPPPQDLVNIINPIKPRHYSIASAQSVHPDQVHLLVVTVDWTNSLGKKRFGHCTRYLAGLKVGEKVTVSIKPSVMKLPPSDKQPVIMAGLGTGMAPFRAFIEERAYRKSLGKEVGPMMLYFGARNRSMEYLYGEELEAYHAEGLLTYLRLAFSRDQPHKVYIQHKMQDDAELLHDYLLKQEGWFYLCGPTWPVPDVRDAIVDSFITAGGLTVSEANDWVNKLKDLERYILEVY